MSERRPSHEPAAQTVIRRMLHKGEQELFVPEKGIYVPDFAGNVLGFLELPPEVGTHAKRIAIVDYGQDFKGKPLVPGAPGLGQAQARIGLRGANFVPETHMMTYAPLPEGKEVVLGRAPAVDDWSSYMLGLTEQDPGNHSISAQQVSVFTDGQQVTATDMSRHGTIVEHLA